MARACEALVGGPTDCYPSMYRVAVRLIRGARVKQDSGPRTGCAGR
ncbi:MAG: hypothetical protein JWM61_1293 [Micrococcaceae bacterium]|jgi:hypothetical protein|nr:hypothetical protein [Micrococcaceae bacterium]